MGVFHDSADACLVEVLATPRARRSAVLGYHGDALKVAVAAPPEDGRANEALRQFFADFLSLPLNSITIQRGNSSRRKRLQLIGIDSVAVKAALEREGITATH